jgi:hypothetical protein
MTQTPRIGQSSAALFFSWTTATEEGVYLDPDSRFIEGFLAFCDRSHPASEVLQIYSRWSGVDITAELHSNAVSLEPFTARLFQTCIHVALAIYIESFIDPKITTVGSYSGGICAAYIHAGVWSPLDYLTAVSPFSNALRGFTMERLKDSDIVDALFLGYPGGNMEGVVQETIAELNMDQSVFITDRRGQCTTLVSGYGPAVRSVLDHVRHRRKASFAEVLIRKAGGAHTGILPRERFSRLLDAVQFRAPRLTIVSSQGHRISPGCADSVVLRDAFEHSCMQPMNTGEAIGTLLMAVDTLIFIGSRRALNVVSPWHTDKRVLHMTDLI